MLNSYFHWVLFYVSTYSLIYFLGEEDIIALQEHDTPFDNEQPSLSEPLNRDTGSNTVGQKRIKCHICEDAECSSSDICEDAITVKILMFCLTFCIKSFFHNMNF